MRISLLIHKYFPYGGQQRDFLKIMTELAERGHSIHVYCFSWQGNLPVDVTVHPVPRRGPGRLAQYRNFAKWTQQEINSKPRHVVVGFPRMPGLDVHFAADPCFVAKAEQQRGRYYRYTPRYRHFSRNEKAVFAAPSKTRVLYLSPQQRSEFSQYYPGCESRLIHLPPGLDSRWRREARDVELAASLRESLQIGEQQFLLLQVGSGFRVKGVDRSLRAIAALPESLRERCTFLVVGDDRSAPFQRLAEKLGLGKQLRFLGGRNDVAELMQAADLLLHPAYSESAGYVLLEAVVSGLPVLTTASCGYAFHVKLADAGEVCASPFEQERLNDALKQMLLNPEQRNWSANGIAYGQQGDLYDMPTKAADAIEQIAAELT